jgi:hypothetical protein
VELCSFQLRFFSLSAKLLIDPRCRLEKVREATGQRLAEEFSFDRRDFAQPVTAAEVVRVIQNVPGIVAVDLDKLYFVTVEASQARGTLGSYLEARPAELDGPADTIRGAELLLLHPAGVALEEKQL